MLASSAADPGAERKPSPAKLGYEDGVPAGMAEDECAFAVGDFLKVFDGALSEQDKQLILDFGASAVELNQAASKGDVLPEGHSMGGTQAKQTLKDRLLQMQVVVLGQVRMILQNHKTIATTTAPGVQLQLEAQDLNQVLRTMQEYQQLKQLYSEEAAKERQAAFRYVDTKPQELRKRDAKALQKQCEQPLAKKENSER